MVMGKRMCHECRLEKGFRLRDSGHHTAVMQKCGRCGKMRLILPSRHWKKESESNERNSN